MNKQGKIWGQTTELFNDQRVSMHFLSISQGGFCSEHKHGNKTNLFYVIEGRLLIRIWRKGDQPEEADDTVLTPGESMIIPTHVWHQFEALTDVKCLEIYETGLWQSDIERRTRGGMRNDRGAQKKDIRGPEKVLEQTGKPDKAGSGNESSLEPREEISGSPQSPGD